jgi:S-adenosylmethionine uptake transporter
MSAQLRAILFILLGVLCGSLNDVGIKLLSGDYPLHQMIFVRSIVGVLVSLVFLHLEGGLALLRSKRPGLHLLRAGLVVFSNMTFFAALAVMPLGAATALFFVAPLFITLLAIPVLGERIGRHRIAAVGVGLLGVAVMMAPGVEWAAGVGGLGALGTWSALATEVAGHLRNHRPAAAAIQIGASVGLGTLAAAAGIGLGSLLG